ncbi:hypothetical protein MNBD_NITROSPINAE04-2641 [hydrothermal vent metagenome]|uniref:Uncharacterized protein n=1 Tax=hydrothermal vent metagenome TaxID=652676 RepID=A0A3B1CII0_9ZZZZ
MKLRYFFALAVILLAPAFSSAGDVSTYSTFKVTFKTLSCEGSEGFGSVDVDEIVRIESSKCEEGDPIPKVYQILVNSRPGASYAYFVYTTTEKEAERVMKGVDRFQEDKAQSLRNSPRIIIDR